MSYNPTWSDMKQALTLTLQMNYRRLVQRGSSVQNFKHLHVLMWAGTCRVGMLSSSFLSFFFRLSVSRSKSQSEKNNKSISFKRSSRRIVFEIYCYVNVWLCCKISFDWEKRKKIFCLVLCSLHADDEESLKPSPSFLLSIAGIDGSLMPYSLAALILQTGSRK